MAPIGDVSPTQPKFLGLSPLGNKEWARKELFDQIDTTDEYNDKLNNTEIGMFAQMIGSNENISDINCNTRYLYNPFGTKLPMCMYNKTRGCTLVSILYCIPQSKIMEIGCNKFVALFDNAQIAFQEVYPNDNVFFASMGKVMRGLNCAEFFEYEKGPDEPRCCYS